MSFSFIHIADIHLGRPFSNISGYSYNETTKSKYNCAVEKAFNNFINFAIEKAVDFVLIAGDTFDNCEQDFKSKLILKEGLKKLDNANIKLFLVCGNHDPIYAYSKNTFNFDETSNIKIIGVNTPISGKFIAENRQNIPVAVVNALSFKENHLEENPLKYFSPAENKNLFNIGLLHCDLDSDNSSPYAPCLSSELCNLNYDYWALGHIHIPTKGNSSINYAGTIQGRNTKETGAHGLKYIKVENNKIIENSFIPTDIVRYENITVNLSSSNDTTSSYNTIQESISDFINENDKCELYILKINLTGNIVFYSEINENFFEIIAQKINDDFSNKVCISEFINNLSPKADEKLLAADDGISGEIYKNSDVNNIKSAIAAIEEEKEFKKFLASCCYSDTEYKELKNEIEKIIKEECINIANNIYYNEQREEV